MSRAFGLVRFPNGKVLIGCYQGSSDNMHPDLATAEELVKTGTSLFDLGWDTGGKTPDDDLEDVDIYSDYGWGTHWRGKASYANRVLVEGLSYGYEDHYENGRFSHTTNVEHKVGQPTWVSDFLDGDEWRQYIDTGRRCK